MFELRYNISFKKNRLRSRRSNFRQEMESLGFSDDSMSQSETEKLSLSPVQSSRLFVQGLLKYSAATEETLMPFLRRAEKHVDVDSKRMGKRLADEKRKADEVTQRAAAMIKVSLINEMEFLHFFIFIPSIQATREALATTTDSVESRDLDELQVLRAQLNAERENSISKDRKLRELQVEVTSIY